LYSFGPHITYSAPLVHVKKGIYQKKKKKKKCINLNIYTYIYVMQVAHNLANVDQQLGLCLHTNERTTKKIKPRFYLLFTGGKWKGILLLNLPQFAVGLHNGNLVKQFPSHHSQHDSINSILLSPRHRFGRTKEDICGCSQRTSAWKSGQTLCKNHKSTLPSCRPTWRVVVL
jgi:hypothetical protein